VDRWRVAYLPGAAGEAANLPGALSLQAKTDPEPEPSPSEEQEETDFHPSLPSGKPRGTHPRGTGYSSKVLFRDEQKRNAIPVFG